MVCIYIYTYDEEEVQADRADSGADKKRRKKKNSPRREETNGRTTTKKWFARKQRDRRVEKTSRGENERRETDRIYEKEKARRSFFESLSLSSFSISPFLPRSPFLLSPSPYPSCHVHLSSFTW